MPEGAEAGELPPAKRRRGRPRLETPSVEYLAKLEEILDAAIEVFRARGYDAASLDDVAAAIDFRRASLYHYVPSKAHLLYLILDRAVSTAIARLETYLEIEDPGECLVALVRNQVLTIAESPGLFKVFFDHRSSLESRYESEIVAKEQRYFREVTTVVRRAVDAGVLPAVDPGYAARLLIGMTSWHYKWIDPGRHDPEALLDTCIGLLVRPPPRSGGATPQSDSGRR